VPVLEDGVRVIPDSARITAYLDERYQPLLRVDPLAVLVEGWAEGPLEDVAFRVATPDLEARFAQLQDGREDARALFRLVKERKYGAGCVEAWRRDVDALSSRLAELLAPVAEAVARHPFLLGQTPTLRRRRRLRSARHGRERRTGVDRGALAGAARLVGAAGGGTREAACLSRAAVGGTRCARATHRGLRVCWRAGLRPNG
jgi:hypothetical protein